MQKTCTLTAYISKVNFYSNLLFGSPVEMNWKHAAHACVVCKQSHTPGIRSKTARVIKQNLQAQMQNSYRQTLPWNILLGRTMRHQTVPQPTLGISSFLPLRLSSVAVGLQVVIPVKNVLLYHVTLRCPAMIGSKNRPPTNQISPRAELWNSPRTHFTEIDETTRLLLMCKPRESTSFHFLFINGGCCQEEWRLNLTLCKWKLWVN